MDIEGKTQFFLDQQVQFSNDLARIHSILERVAATQDRTTAILGIQAEGLSKLEELTHRIGERQITFEDTVAGFAERQSKCEQTILQVGQTLVGVADAQEYTNRILVTLAERQVDTERARLAIEEAIRRLAEMQVDSERARLATEEAMRRLAERQVATEEALRSLAERQKITEENLNVLLLTVERHISGHK